MIPCAESWRNKIPMTNFQLIPGCNSERGRGPGERLAVRFCGHRVSFNEQTSASLRALLWHAISCILIYLDLKGRAAQDSAHTCGALRLCIFS
ncbi:uncharacterized protein [Melanerpes formicivorus]|uniref:uncharacterized protein n=1 Tax=Melanerpes formicivorus TaxID=211600 RepID=UPI00358E2B69